MWWWDAAAAGMASAGLWLIVSDRRRRCPPLEDRLAPYQRPWVADEAERWLRDR